MSSNSGASGPQGVGPWIAKLKEEGNLKFRDGEVEEAVTCYTEALRLDPSNAVILSNRAHCLVLLGRFHKALKDAKQVISMDPTFVKARLRLIAALRGLCRFREALAEAERGHEIDPVMFQQVLTELRTEAETRKKDNEAVPEESCVLDMARVPSSISPESVQAMRAELAFYLSVGRDRLHRRREHWLKRMAAANDGREMNDVFACLTSELQRQYHALSDVSPRDSVARVICKWIECSVVCEAMRLSRVPGAEAFSTVKARMNEGLRLELHIDTDIDDLVKMVPMNTRDSLFAQLSRPMQRSKPNQMPPLFDGPPEWATDPEWTERQASPLFGQLVQINMSQRQSDVAFRLINLLYKGTSTATIREHLKRHNGFGVDVKLPHSITDSETEMSKEVTRDEFLRLGTWTSQARRPVAVDEEEKVFPRLQVFTCDHCGAPTAKECLCGEIFCSRSCQKAEWTNHRQLCSTVRGELESLELLTYSSWGVL